MISEGLGDFVFVTTYRKESTSVINEVRRQKSQTLQVFGCGSREGHYFSDGLVETLVSSVPQKVGQVAVGHLVLVVAHLMVHSEEVVHVDLGAHLYPGDIAAEVLMSAVRQGDAFI